MNWYVVICSSAANSVTLRAGGGSGDAVDFATWTQGQGQKVFPIPDRFQGESSIWVQLTISPEGRQTEACVGYQGKAKKAFHMNGGPENHQIDKDDSEDGCACV